jgi:cytochrome P450
MKLNSLYTHEIFNRYLPTKTNRKSWILAKEVKSLILEVVNERKEKTCFEMDLLQMVIEGSKKSNFTQEASDNFIIDNCKNISLAAESTAVVASWCLMLLATNQNWQDRARAEVLEICRGRIPDYDMLSRMKQVTKNFIPSKPSKWHIYTILPIIFKLLTRYINYAMNLKK